MAALIRHSVGLWASKLPLLRLPQRPSLSLLGTTTQHRLRTSTVPTFSRIIQRAYASSAHHDHDHDHGRHQQSKAPEEPYDQTEQILAFGSFLVFGSIFTYLSWTPVKAGSSQPYKLLPREDRPLRTTESAALASSSSSNADETQSPGEPSPAITTITAEPPLPEGETRPLAGYYKYVLVGAGTASYHALRAIKSSDPQAEILVIGHEEVPPYSRPQLSKEMWQSPSSTTFRNASGQEVSVFYKDRGAYAIVESDPESGEMVYKCPPASAGRVPPPILLLGHRVTKLDIEKQQITLDTDRVVQYGKVLLATGGTPRELPLVRDLPPHLRAQTSTFRTLADYEALEKESRVARQIVVIGGGFLGSELACTLAQRTSSPSPPLTTTTGASPSGPGKPHRLQVTQVLSGSTVLNRVLPRYLSRWTTEQIADLGVDVLRHKEITRISETESLHGPGSTPKLSIEFKDGAVVEADHIVQAIGIDPDVALARQAGLEIDAGRGGGIVVNAELEARRNVYVAGDAASYYDTLLGRRRLEHYDNAAQMGHLAGKNMAGESNPYTHQPLFWSDLGPAISFEAVGKVDARMPTASVWARDEPTPAPATEALTEDYKRGIVFYLEDNHIVGMVVWNLPGKIELARQVVLRGEFKYKHVQGLTRMFNIHQVEPKREPEA
ncbi:hypothetical protein BJ085DRAFT_22620 [Dimargaris cristalligena]|uniref:FAD/NAD(P)-binding domain-containing protein n=1 Tax=Dimargaris cristalligena TaxID=215637 RepID=A0A4P9ZY82_9FUNG|nr:hypothetical protein BJ085DRAFT_22620 [Dimargaris cristalligena]|eukprot:RKP38656.1 hypothetical protein BJ085DRAFT_22620 [Dimargaris cristalligena]